MLEQINRIDVEATKQTPDGRIILAHGEATGHHHSIDAEAADWWKTSDGKQFVDVHTATRVIHQEHAPIDLLPGLYRVHRQREYSPEEIRSVTD